MGRPNDPCFDQPSIYDRYSSAVTVTTTSTTTTTIAPEDVDFFILPDESAQCPSIYFDPSNEDVEFDNPDVTYICSSPYYDPSPCVITVKKYIRVADIDINVNSENRCQRFALRLINQTAPTITAIPTVGVNSANYGGTADWNGASAGNVTTVGSNGRSSAYGTYDQSGNVWEWNDLDGLPGPSRGLRGGNWFNDADGILGMSSSSMLTGAPSTATSFNGFRLASSLNPLSLPNFVFIGDANNLADSTGYGSVSYSYYIGKYPVTNCEYVEFLNSVAATDTYNLYNVNMSTSFTGGINRSLSFGNYIYTVKPNMDNKPVVWVSWFSCARYCNWLHNGKPTGPQNSSTTETGAYTLNGAIAGFSITRNVNANYHIPTENEWYKAAYYKGGGINAGYWTYATQSNIIPASVTASSTGDGFLNGSPARITDYICSAHKMNHFKLINSKLYIDSSVIDFNQPSGVYSTKIALIDLITGKIVKTVEHSVNVIPSRCIIPTTTTSTTTSTTTTTTTSAPITTTTTLEPPPLSFDDYIVIFADEALFPSSPGVYGYVNQSPSNTPNSYWYEDLTIFNRLVNTQGIDPNKVLIFWVWSVGPGGVGSIRYPLYPTVNVQPGYEMPIPLDRIVLSPRNVPNILQNGQALTGQWIMDRISEKFGIIPNNKKIVVFVDDSPSLTFNAVATGVNQFLALASINYRTQLIKCITERWLRWIVATFNGNPVCS